MTTYESAGYSLFSTTTLPVWYSNYVFSSDNRGQHFFMWYRDDVFGSVDLNPAPASSLLRVHLKTQSTTKAHFFYEFVTEEKLCCCFHFIVCSALIKGATCWWFTLKAWPWSCDLQCPLSVSSDKFGHWLEMCCPRSWSLWKHKRTSTGGLCLYHRIFHEYPLFAYILLICMLGWEFSIFVLVIWYQ